MKVFLSLVSSGMLALLAVGCGPQPTANTPAKQAADRSHDDHDHHGTGPHGGTIVEWGGGSYHLEFTVDHDKKESVVYVLGGDATTAAPVKAAKLLLTINEPSFQVELIAQPHDGELDGMCSRFVGQHDTLGKVQEFSGSITAEVDGTPYAGDFAESAAGHDHAHK